MSAIQLNGATSGSVTLTPPAVAGTNTLTLPAKTGNIITSADSGTVTGTMLASATVTPSNLSQPFTSIGAVASTSGTAITFTGIPSWAKRVTIMVSGVTMSASTTYLGIQVGNGSLVSSGYSGLCSQVTGTNLCQLFSGFTSNFFISNIGAGSSFSGSVFLNLVGSNTWVLSGNISDVGAGRSNSCNGTITLSSALDRVSVTQNGIATFTAGSINVFYE